MTEAADRYARAFDLFTQARDLTAAERDALLAGSEPALRAEVLALLNIDRATNDGESESRLREGLEAAAARMLSETAAVPERIGPYAVRRTVAHGGQATVYEAEQESPRRRVALKVLRSGALGSQAVRRFERETATLAQLAHPDIVTIHDAGVMEAPDGPLHYFAMEWIDGMPLDRHAEAVGLDVHARLALMADVCAAVEHAHDEGIVHRDLKPGNILVDDEGRPRILDFGVAHATGSDLDAVTLATTQGQVIGTLPFMSPEQVRGDADAIGAASDVYAIGVLLHLLLVGEVPHAHAMHSVAHAARQIEEHVPRAVGTHDSSLRGDIETIIAKALEHDPGRRYPSAGALEADLRRFLASEPIEARPASALYVLGRFARRRKALAASLAGLVAVLVAGSIVSLLFAATAREEADLANRRGEALERENARSRVVAASAALGATDPRTARRHLTAVPTALRDWVWHVLDADLDHRMAAPPRLAIGEAATVHDLVAVDATALAAVVGNEAAGEHGNRWMRLDRADGTVTEERRLPAGVGAVLARRGTAVCMLTDAGVLVQHRWQKKSTSRVEGAHVHRLLGYLGEGQHVVLMARLNDGGFELRTLDVDAGVVAGRWPGTNESVAFAASPTGTAWALADHDGVVRLFDGPGQEEPRRIRAHESPIQDIAFAPDGRSLISVDRHGRVVVTDRDDDTHRPVGWIDPMAAGRIAVGPDGGRVAFAAVDGTLRVLDLHAHERQLVLHGHPVHVASLRPLWRGDGDLVTIVERSGARHRFRANRDVARPSLRAHRGPVLELAISADGARMVSIGVDGNAVLWDLEREQARGSLHVGRPTGVAFGPGDDVFALAFMEPTGTRGIHVMDTATGAHRRTLDVPASARGRLRFDGPDPRYVHEDAPTRGVSVTFAGGSRRARALEGQAIDVLDTSDDEVLLTLGPATRRVTCLAVAKDTGALYAGGEDGHVRIWRVRPYAQLAVEDAKAPRTLAWGGSKAFPARPPLHDRRSTEHVRLLDAGASPRNVIAYADATDGLAAQAIWTRRVKLRLGGAALEPAKIPPLEVAFTLHGEREGRSATWTPTLSDGRAKPRELRELVEALWCPLPPRAVGLGARWEATQVTRTATGRHVRRGHFTLVRKADEGWIVDARYVRSSPDLLGEAPGLPRTIRMRATEAREETQGTFEVRPGFALPAKADLERRASVDVQIEARGERPSVGFAVQGRLQLRVRRAP